jgi:hypothetical protein
MRRKEATRGGRRQEEAGDKATACRGADKTTASHAKVPTKPEHCMPPCNHVPTDARVRDKRHHVCETRDGMCVRRHDTGRRQGCWKEAEDKRCSRRQEMQQKTRDARMLLSRRRHKTRQERISTASNALLLCSARVSCSCVKLLWCAIVYQHCRVPWSGKALALRASLTNLMPSYPHSYVQCVW